VQGGGDRRGVESKLDRHRSCGQRVRNAVLARDSQEDLASSARTVQHKGAAFEPMQANLVGPDLRPLRQPVEGDSAGGRRHRPNPGIVRIQHREPACGQSLNQFPLGGRDPFDRSEEPDMGEADVENHADVRRGGSRQLSNLTGA